MKLGVIALIIQQYGISLKQHQITCLSVEINKFMPKDVHRKFKFENMRFQDPHCLEVVQQSWDSNIGYCLTNRLRKCGDALEKWGHSNLKQLTDLIKGQKSKIESLRGKRDDYSMGELNTGEKQLNLLLRQEEEY